MVASRPGFEREGRRRLTIDHQEEALVKVIGPSPLELLQERDELAAVGRRPEREDGHASVHVGAGDVHSDMAADRGLREQDVSRVFHPGALLALLALDAALVHEGNALAPSEHVQQVFGCCPSQLSDLGLVHAGFVEEAPGLGTRVAITYPCALVERSQAVHTDPKGELLEEHLAALLQTEELELVQPSSPSDEVVDLLWNDAPGLAFVPT